MGEVAVVLETNLVTFGEVNFEEASVLSRELMERVQPFDDACPFGPAAAHAGGQCDDRDPPVPESIATE